MCWLLWGLIDLCGLITFSREVPFRKGGDERRCGSSPSQAYATRPCAIKTFSRFCPPLTVGNRQRTNHSTSPHLGILVVYSWG